MTEFPLLLQCRKDSGHEIRHVVILKSAGRGGEGYGNGIWKGKCLWSSRQLGLAGVESDVVTHSVTCKVRATELQIYIIFI